MRWRASAVTALLLAGFVLIGLGASPAAIACSALPETPTEQQFLDQADVVVVPLGGGGLLSGIAIAVKALRPDVRVIGVQAAGVPAFTELALVVRVAEAHHEGPVLRGLLHALSGAAVNLRADPQPALGALLAGAPGLDRGFELAVLQRTVPLLLPSTRALPFGYQDPRAWGAFGAWMLAHHLISRPARAELAVTNEFLPGQGE